ncbi:MAG: ABC transporter permease [Acidimicrobiales bacterium]
MSQVIRVAWYRFRATFGRRWGGYLTIIVLIGGIGGIAIGSIAAARRTESSFPTFLASTNPSNLVVIPGPQNPANNYSPATTSLLAHLPNVRHLEDASISEVFPLGPNGLPQLSAAANKDITMVASIGGLGFTQDRATVISGRMADPSNPHEIVMTAVAAGLLHVHLGSRMAFGLYTPTQVSNLPVSGIPTVTPNRTVEVRVVGLVVLGNEVVQDDIDRYPTEILFTRALAHELLSPPFLGSEGWTEYGLQLAHGNADVAAVEREIGDAVGPHTLLLFQVTSLIESEAQRAIAPQVIALFVFGLIAALAALLVVLQAVSRQLQTLGADLEVMRALGADARMTTADGLIGIVGAIVLGSLIAAAVAVGLSPFSPIGPVRHVYPTPGIAFDWTVLGLGLVVLIFVLVGGSVALALRRTPDRAARKRQRTAVRPSTAVRVAVASGLPAPAVAGVRFALAPGSGRSSVPVRSAMFGAMLAMIIVVATLTFGASLRTLASEPALYGWNWSYALQPVNDPVSFTPPQFQSLLRRDLDVDAWTTVQFFTLGVDGQAVPFMFEPPDSSIAPPLLSGHAVLGPDQVVLGSATLAALHKRIGDTVEASYEGQHVTLRVVGTATFPAIGINGTFHPSTGTGALASTQLLPSGTDRFCGQQADMVLIKMRPTVTAAAALANTQRIADETNRIFAAVPESSNCYGDLVSVLPVQRPAEIADYRTVGSTPALLAAALALAAVTALGLTLAASVRRRRSDLATLKALGFTKRQLLSTVCWQSSVSVSIGIVVGVPLGIALGRWLWTLFARYIYVVPEPTVPLLSVILVIIGALVFANLVATIPGRIAASTPTARVLGKE